MLIQICTGEGGEGEPQYAPVNDTLHTPRDTRSPAGPEGLWGSTKQYDPADASIAGCGGKHKNTPTASKGGGGGRGPSRISEILQRRTAAPRANNRTKKHPQPPQQNPRDGSTKPTNHWYWAPLRSTTFGRVWSVMGRGGGGGGGISACFFCFFFVGEVSTAGYCLVGCHLAGGICPANSFANCRFWRSWHGYSRRPTARTATMQKKPFWNGNDHEYQISRKENPHTRNPKRTEPPQPSAFADGETNDIAKERHSHTKEKQGTSPTQDPPSAKGKKQHLHAKT